MEQTNKSLCRIISHPHHPPFLPPPTPTTLPWKLVAMRIPHTASKQ